MVKINIIKKAQTQNTKVISGLNEQRKTKQRIRHQEQLSFQLDEGKSLGRCCTCLCFVHWVRYEFEKFSLNIHTYSISESEL